MRTPETEARVFLEHQRVETPFGPGTVVNGAEVVARDPKWGDLPPVGTGRVLVDVDTNPLATANPLAFWKDELTPL